MSDNTTINVLPENIRKNLAKSQIHHKLLCLECGYDGLMGQCREIDHWRWPLVVIAIFLAVFGIYFYGFGGTNEWMDAITALLFFSFPMWVYLVVGLAVSYFVKYTIPVYLCPNCEREITRK